MINCVYIHIPFCVKKCNYCAFCSFPALFALDNYVEALIKEIKFYYKNEKLKTLYFGGGTPYLLQEGHFEKILKCFNFDDDTEITLEINPYNLKKEKLSTLKDFGINRISLGVQNFDDEILIKIGRLNNSNDIFKSIDLIKTVGFDNYSIDLMYGLPNQNMKNWEKTLETALDLKPQHISLYGLKIEKGTYFYKFLPKNLPDDDMQANMYKIAINKLSEYYFHYEFSNFALGEKFFSGHNISYWTCQNYYGFGLSASGYIGNKRYTNTFSMQEYLKNPKNKEYNALSYEELLEEELFLGLRLLKGIDFNYINKKFNIDVLDKYKKVFDKFTKLNLMEYTPVGIKLTTDGVLLSNEILCEFINV